MLLLPPGCGVAPPEPVLVTDRDPGQVTYGDDGTRYVLEPLKGRVTATSPGGQVTTMGSYGIRAGQVNVGVALAVGATGRVYVADLGNHRIQIFQANGAHLGSIGGFGTDRGQLISPNGLAMSRGRLLVSDTGNQRVQAFDAQSRESLGFFGGAIDSPGAIAVGPDGTVHVADALRGRIMAYDDGGMFLGRYGQLGYASSLAVDASGRIWAGDLYNARLSVFTSDGQLSSIRELSHQGLPARARHLSFDLDGNLLVTAITGA